MSQHVNHRRDGKRHQDNGPTYESHTPNAGCNSTHVARGRKRWKDLVERARRRLGKMLTREQTDELDLRHNPMAVDEDIYPHPAALDRQRIERLEDLIVVFNSVEEGCRDHVSIMVNGGAEKGKAEAFTRDLLKRTTFKKFPEIEAAIDCYEDGMRPSDEDDELLEQYGLRDALKGKIRIR